MILTGRRTRSKTITQSIFETACERTAQQFRDAVGETQNECKSSAGSCRTRSHLRVENEAGAEMFGLDTHDEPRLVDLPVLSAGRSRTSHDLRGPFLNVALRLLYGPPSRRFCLGLFFFFLVVSREHALRWIVQGNRVSVCWPRGCSVPPLTGTPRPEDQVLFQGFEEYTCSEGPSVGGIMTTSTIFPAPMFVRWVSLPAGDVSSKNLVCGTSWTWGPPPTWMASHNAQRANVGPRCLSGAGDFATSQSEVRSSRSHFMLDTFRVQPSCAQKDIPRIFVLCRRVPTVATDSAPSMTVHSEQPVV